MLNYCFWFNRLLTSIRNGLKNEDLQNKNKVLRKKIDLKHNMIGESIKMIEIKNTIEKISGTDARVLITGSNGTGKELIAHAIHKNSKRSKNTND